MLSQRDEEALSNESQWIRTVLKPRTKKKRGLYKLSHSGRGCIQERWRSYILLSNNTLNRKKRWKSGAVNESFFNFHNFHPTDIKENLSASSKWNHRFASTLAQTEQEGVVRSKSTNIMHAQSHIFVEFIPACLRSWEYLMAPILAFEWMSVCLSNDVNCWIII